MTGPRVLHAGAFVLMDEALGIQVFRAPFQAIKFVLPPSAHPVPVWLCVGVHTSRELQRMQGRAGSAAEQLHGHSVLPQAEQGRSWFWVGGVRGRTGLVGWALMPWRSHLTLVGVGVSTEVFPGEDSRLCMHRHHISHLHVEENEVLWLVFRPGGRRSEST